MIHQCRLRMGMFYNEKRTKKKYSSFLEGKKVDWVVFYLFKLKPKTFKLCSERLEKSSLGKDGDVLVVAEVGVAGPVVAAVDEHLAVHDGELVVHVELALVLAHLDALVPDLLDVGAQRLRLVVVRDHPHLHAPVMRRD